jgi:hypothetical protein
MVLVTPAVPGATGTGKSVARLRSAPNPSAIAAISGLLAGMAICVALVSWNGAPPRNCIDAGAGTICGVVTLGVGVVATRDGGLHDAAVTANPNTSANLEDFIRSPADMKKLLGNGGVAIVRTAVRRLALAVPRDVGEKIR